MTSVAVNGASSTPAGVLSPQSRISALLLAASEGHAEPIVQAVKEDASGSLLLTVDYDGMSLLHRAAFRGHSHLVRSMVGLVPPSSRPAFLLKLDASGNTACNYACLANHGETVRALLEAAHAQGEQVLHAMVNAQNNRGWSALFYVAVGCEGSDFALLDLLLAAGADPSLRDAAGRTPDAWCFNRGTRDRLAQWRNAKGRPRRGPGGAGAGGLGGGAIVAQAPGHDQQVGLQMQPHNLAQTHGQAPGLQTLPFAPTAPTVDHGAGGTAVPQFQFRTSPGPSPGATAHAVPQHPQQGQQQQPRGPEERHVRFKNLGPAGRAAEETLRKAKASQAQGPLMGQDPEPTTTLAMAHRPPSPPLSRRLAFGSPTEEGQVAGPDSEAHLRGGGRGLGGLAAAGYAYGQQGTTQAGGIVGGGMGGGDGRHLTHAYGGHGLGPHLQQLDKNQPSLAPSRQPVGTREVALPAPVPPLPHVLRPTYGLGASVPALIVHQDDLGGGGGGRGGGGRGHLQGPGVGGAPSRAPLSPVRPGTGTGSTPLAMLLESARAHMNELVALKRSEGAGEESGPTTTFSHKRLLLEKQLALVRDLEEIEGIVGGMEEMKQFLLRGQRVLEM